jgi:hypothetical protein
VTNLACWVQIGNDFIMDRGMHFEVRSDLMVIGSALEDHAKTHGAYPDSLGDLEMHQDHVATEQDDWDHPYHYRQTPSGFELGTLGRDGRPGGSGLDADLFYSPDDNFPPTHRLTLSQFLFDTEGSRSVFIVAAIASLLSAAIWFRAQSTERPAGWQLALSLGGTTLAAVLVAVILAIVHVTASQSGH